MIASIGLLVFMEDGFRIVFGEQGLTFVRNPYPTQIHHFFGIIINTVQIAMIAVSTLCLTALALFTTRTRTGIAWRATVTNPVIAKSPQRFVSRFMPTFRKGLRMESANFDLIRNLAFDKNEICWSQIRFKIYERFDRCER